jgi:glycosyltransferase involved in cell wall biosynthesis
MRVLMVTDTPWDRRLGGPRVQIEVGEQFERLGHEVDSYSWTDAYPEEPKMARLAGFVRNFPRKAESFIRAHGGRYDVIDARSGSLAASKQRLGFEGLLVTRSNGLLPIYEREFLAPLRRSDPAAGGRLATRVPRALQRRQLNRRAQAGFDHCDLLNVLNTDEEIFARNHLGAEAKTVKLLHGLTRERFEAFQAARVSPAERLEQPVIAFVGSWSRRKGSDDAAAIIRAVRARFPAATFRFLGVGASEQKVHEDCGGGSGIEVVPSFESDELPALLGTATVGILPSYVEGFPFSIIELLAAAAPVVAYDAPGARELLPRLDETLLVPRGEASSFGDRIGDVLGLPLAQYTALSARAAEIADSLRWEEIAAETSRIYEERFERLRD